MSTNPYDTLLSELESKAAPKQPRAPKNRYGAYEAQTEGDWSISRAPQVKDWYKQTYGRDLPVTAEGQSGTHNRMGLNHSDSLDVGINPTTPEGQAFVSYLRQNRIPFLAYDRAVPGAATNAHVHVGYPSKRGTPADPYDALLSELESAPAEPRFPAGTTHGTVNPSPATPLPSQATPPQSPEAGATLPAVSQAQPAPAGMVPPPPVLLPNRQRDVARQPTFAAPHFRAPDPLAGQDAQEGEEVVRGPVGLPTNPRGYAKASDVSGDEFQDAVYKVQVRKDDSAQNVVHRFITQAVTAAKLPPDLESQFLEQAYQYVSDGRAVLKATAEAKGLTAEQLLDQAKRAGALALNAPALAESLQRFQKLADDRARASVESDVRREAEAAYMAATGLANEGGGPPVGLNPGDREKFIENYVTEELNRVAALPGSFRGERERKARVGALQVGAVSGDARAGAEYAGRHALETVRGAGRGVAGIAQGAAVAEEALERTGLPLSVPSRVFENFVGRLYSGVTGRRFEPGRYADERLAYQWGEAVKESLGEDRDLAPELSFKVFGAVGSSAPFLAGSILSGGGPAVAGILGALQETGDTYGQLTKKGVTGDRRLGYSLAGGAVGFSEMFGLGGAFNRATGGTFTRSFARWLVASGREASEEAIQEFFQTAAGQAVIARAAKEDPNWPRILSDAFESAKVAAVTGGVVGGGMHASAGGAHEQTLAPKPVAPQTQTPTVAPVAVPETVTPQPVQPPAVAPGSKVRIAAGQMEGETGTVAEVESGVALVRLSGGGETRISVSRVEPVAVETPVAPAQDDDGELPPPPVPTAEDERLAREEAEYVRGGERYSQPLPQAPEVVTPAEAAPQHHSQFQPRRQRGDGKGQFKKATRAELAALRTQKANGQREPWRMTRAEVLGESPAVDEAARNWNEEAFFTDPTTKPGVASEPFHTGPVRNTFAGFDEQGNPQGEPRANQFAAAPDLANEGRMLLMSRVVTAEGKPVEGALGEWSPVGEYVGGNLGVALAYRGQGAGTAFEKYLMSSGERKGPSIGYSPEGLKAVERAHRSLIEDALREGRPVPAAVLADYPDLAPTASSPAPLKSGRLETPPPVQPVSKAVDSPAANAAPDRLNAPDPSALRDRFKRGMTEHFKLPEHQAEGVATVADELDRGLTKWGVGRGSLLGRVTVGAGTAEGDVLNQTQPNRAATQFLKDGTAVIRALNNPNVSSGAHEVHHVFAPELAKATLATPNATLRETGEAFFDWLGFNGARDFADLHQDWVDGALTGRRKARYVQGQEKGARGFERYMKTGDAPSTKLRQVFADFKDWLTGIYGAVRGKNHPLSGQLSPEAIKAWDTALGAPKGEYGQLINALYKAPSEGTPAFFENAQVKRTLGLRPDATTADVRAALTEQIGRPRSSHLSPEDVKAWADSKNLRGAAREALDFAVGKYAETVKAPTAYQQTGIRRRNVDPTTQSLAEFVRAAGGIRIDRDGANRGELEALTNKESGSTGLVRKDGVSVYEMARMAAEAGYPVATGGGYYTDEGMMRRAAGSEEPDADALLEALARDLGGERVYSHQREIDYEELYRKENPDDNTDALDSFLANEENGILFDKVSYGTANQREVEEFRRVAQEAGLFPEYVRTVVAQGKRAKAEGVQAPVGDEAAGAFDFRDDPLEAEPILFQRSHPRQLGFVQEGLTQESARREAPKPQAATTNRALRAESAARLSALKDSPVARLAAEVERRVNPSNTQNVPDLLAALSKLAELKRQKQTVDDYLNQGSLFGGRELTPAQERILGALDRNPRRVIEEAFPAEKQPEQTNLLFQSAETAGAPESKADEAARLWRERGTESPYFKRWFDGSKVVDEKGEPLVVYHGTAAAFNAFDPVKAGSTFEIDDAGFFFTNDKDLADKYADAARVIAKRKGETPNERTIDAFVSLQNPWVIYVDTDKQPAIAHFEGGEGQFNRGQGYIIRYAMESGYDGVIIQDKRGLANHDALIIAFRPEQIKSATGNRGTFDPSDPNILFQSDHTQAARRQRAYRALLEAKGQGTLTPEMRAERASRTRMGANRSADRNQPALTPELEAPKPKRGPLDTAVNVANAIRALNATGEFSFLLRQGGVGFATHPIGSLRAANRSRRALVQSREGHKTFEAELKKHPEYALAVKSGLELTDPSSKSRAAREEDYQSEFVGRMPVVRNIEQATTSFLNAQRLAIFSAYAKQLRKAGAPESAYKEAARLANYATGRGDLGRLNAHAPLLTTVLFSPRYTASRFQLLNKLYNPAAYFERSGGSLKLKPTARIQLTEAVKYAGVISATLYLAAQAGASVSLDPEDPNFGKIKWGKYSYDITSGNQAAVKYLLRSARALKRHTTGEEAASDADFLKLTQNFLTNKTAPGVRVGYELMRGKDIVTRQPTTPVYDPKGQRESTLVKSVTPIFARELWQAMSRDGFYGLGAQVPNALGVGVSDERDFQKSNTGRGRTSSRPARQGRATR